MNTETRRSALWAGWLLVAGSIVAWIGAFSPMLMMPRGDIASNEALLRFAAGHELSVVVRDGGFLGGAILTVFGFAALTATFRAAGAPPGEVEWLRGGMAFLNQLHLFFVAGWLIFLGLGLLVLGQGLLRLPGLLRLCGILVLVGGIVILASMAADYWLPTYGETAPGAVLVLSGVFALGISIGLIGTDLLSFLLERDRGRVGAS